MLGLNLIMEKNFKLALKYLKLIINLIDMSGKKITLAEVKGDKGTLVIFPAIRAHGY